MYVTYSKRLAIYEAGSNGAKSERASPVPINLMGTEVNFSIASATPPFADPSNLVTTNPVMFTASINVNAWLIPF
jgi:hypothetical protein